MNWKNVVRDFSLLVFILAAVGWGTTAIMDNPHGYMVAFWLLVVSATIYVFIGSITE